MINYLFYLLIIYLQIILLQRLWKKFRRDKLRRKMKTQDVEVIKLVEDELKQEKEEAAEKEREKRRQEYLHKKRILKRVFPYINILL